MEKETNVHHKKGDIQKDENASHDLAQRRYQCKSVILHIQERNRLRSISTTSQWDQYDTK